MKNIQALCEETKSIKEKIKEFLETHKCEIKSAAGAAAAVIGAPLVLGAAGFGAGGVAAGSLAAKVQTTLYGAGTTGIFSTLQSAGAAGIGTSANVVIAGVGKYVGNYFCDLEIPSESLTSAESLSKDAASHETKSKDEISEIKEYLDENKYKVAGVATAVIGAPLAAGAAVGAAAVIGAAGAAVGAAGAALGAAGLRTAGLGTAGLGTSGLGTAGLGAAGLASAVPGIFSNIGGMGGHGGTYFRNSDILSECPARDSKSKAPIIFCSEDGQCLICQ